MPANIPKVLSFAQMNSKLVWFGLGRIRELDPDDVRVHGALHRSPDLDEDGHIGFAMRFKAQDSDVDERALVLMVAERLARYLDVRVRVLYTDLVSKGDPT